MVKYWWRTTGSRFGWRPLVNGVGAAATGVVTLIVVSQAEVRRGRLARDRRDSGPGPRDSSVSTATTAVLAAGSPPVRPPSSPRPRPGTRRCSSVESIDEAADRALWFARRVSGGSLRALHVPAHGTDPGIRPRWFHHAGGEPQLEVLDPSLGAVDAVLEQVWRLPRGESDFVTVVVPEQFQLGSHSSNSGRPDFDLPEGTSPRRARRRRGRRSGSGRTGCLRDRQARRARNRGWSQCHINARGQLRADPRHRGHARCPLRVQPR